MTTERHGASTTPPIGAQGSIARLYDGVLGGKDNYRKDRAVVANLLGILPQLQRAAAANAAFIPRAVQAVAELGVHQFLDLGCGLPKATGTTLQAAQRFHPQARVVYVDNDSQVAVHGRALLEVEDRSVMVMADAREVDHVLECAAGLLDFEQPVAVIAAALAHFWPDDDHPAQILRRYTAALPAGGFVIFTHARGDRLPAAVLEQAVAVYSQTAPIFPRTASQIAAFLEGFDVIEPGLVEASQWRPSGAPVDEIGQAQFLAAVARFAQHNEIRR